jgi:hypothetical protein
MFKENRKHHQPYLISNVNDLPEKQRKGLEASWAGTFYREFFKRLDERPFAVLYVDFPSRPNAPVNELVSLEYLKSAKGWTDEEMYDHYMFDLQTRYALGLHQLGEAHFEMRTIYNFRSYLSEYMQETGINLLEKAFEQVTDEQIAAFGLRTGKQRMDSTMLASNIRQMGRVQLLVEVLQRVHRMLSEADQEHYAEAFAPYLRGHSGQYVYRMKYEDTTAHLQQIGEFMQRLLDELQFAYLNNSIYQVLKRVFSEHFEVKQTAVVTKPNEALSTNSMQSPDDLEATYREKNGKGYQGYVTNVTETCDPKNPLQLITKVQVAPNNTDDSQLLAEALPNLTARTGLKTIITDGGHGSPKTDVVLNDHKVEHVQTAIRGRIPDPNKLHLSDFAIKINDDGKPVKVTCPEGQTVAIQTSSQKKAFVAHFVPEACQTCPLVEICPAQPGKRDRRYHLRFTQAGAHNSERRRRSKEFLKEGRNLRAAVEATMRSIKLPFPAGKLPVRGIFRIACLTIGSGAVINVRRIQRYLELKMKDKKRQEKTSNGKEEAQKHLGVSFFVSVKSAFAVYSMSTQSSKLCLNW